jgi:hypothetical protein
MNLILVSTFRSFCDEIRPVLDKPQMPMPQSRGPSRMPNTYLLLDCQRTRRRNVGGTVKPLKLRLEPLPNVHSVAVGLHAAVNVRNALATCEHITSQTAVSNRGEKADIISNSRAVHSLLMLGLEVVFLTSPSSVASLSVGFRLSRAVNDHSSSYIPPVTQNE